MNYIIFGFEHYNPLGIARSLGEYGITPIGIFIENKRKIASKSKYFDKVYVVKNIEEGYSLLVKEFGNETKDIIFTSDDQITGLLDARYDELKDRFYFNNAGEKERVNFYMDKWNICELAKEVGIPVADTLEIKKADVLSGKVDLKSIQYPVITKAINSKIDNWKADSFICRTAEEFRNAFERIRSEAVLVQQYIKKKNELCLDGCVWNKGKEVLISIASTYDYILPDTYSPLMTVRAFENKELETKIKEMFSKIGFEGIFSIEFLVGEENELYFLEINFRNSTWSYASTVAAMNLPVIWSKGMVDATIKSEKKPIDKPFTAMVELDDFRNRVKYGVPYKIGLFNWLIEFQKARCKYYWSMLDMGPLWAIIFNKFKR